MHVCRNYNKVRARTTLQGKQLFPYHPRVVYANEFPCPFPPCTLLSQDNWDWQLWGCSEFNLSDPHQLNQQTAPCKSGLNVCFIGESHLLGFSLKLTQVQRLFQVLVLYPRYTYHFFRQHMLRTLKNIYVPVLVSSHITVAYLQCLFICFFSRILSIIFYDK